VGSNPANRIFAVDWSMIYAVQPSGGEATYVVGQLLRPAQFAGTGTTRISTSTCRREAGRSVTNALEFLRASCQRRTKFD